MSSLTGVKDAVLGGLPKGVHMPLQIKVVESDATEGKAPTMEHALRSLARMMIRSYRAHGDSLANAPAPGSSSALTVVPHRSPDDVDDAA